MKLRYETRHVTTVVREDVSKALVDRVLRGLALQGPPYFIAINPQRYADPVSFTLAQEGEKSFLQVRWGVCDADRKYPKISPEERAEASALIGLVMSEYVHYVLIPLSRADMSVYAEQPCR